MDPAKVAVVHGDFGGLEPKLARRGGVRGHVQRVRAQVAVGKEGDDRRAALGVDHDVHRHSVLAHGRRAVDVGKESQWVLIKVGLPHVQRALAATNDGWRDRVCLVFGHVFFAKGGQLQDDGRGRCSRCRPAVPRHLLHRQVEFGRPVHPLVARLQQLPPQLSDPLPRGALAVRFLALKGGLDATRKDLLRLVDHAFQLVQR
mmetsp:Transcript_2582/g.6251  ORF Transcript_2582/g.6251 Transcript_2582/m.6251 type:complete len:202 (-) Transcript_2582:109-714(-)